MDIKCHKCGRSLGKWDKETNIMTPTEPMFMEDDSFIQGGQWLMYKKVKCTWCYDS